MLVDLRGAVKRLAGGSGEADEAVGAEGSDAVHRSAAATRRRCAGGSVMVVESDVQMQDVFRRGFKQAGYRVLVTADPERAAGRFRQDAGVADCVLFNAQQIGPMAMKMFNELGEDKRTEAVPAVLLLDEGQQQWKPEARMAWHRIVLLHAHHHEATPRGAGAVAAGRGEGGVEGGIPRERRVPPATQLAKGVASYGVTHGDLSLTKCDNNPHPRPAAPPSRWDATTIVEPRGRIGKNL